MPNYDYFCPENGQTIEVAHRLSETISTWGELCERAGIEPNGVAPESPVQRRLGSPYIGGAGSAKSAPAPSGGGCCNGGGCGCH